MQNNNSKLTIALLITLIIFSGVCVWKLINVNNKTKNDMVVVPAALTSTTQDSNQSDYQSNQITYKPYTILNGPSFEYRSDLKIENIRNTYFTFYKDTMADQKVVIYFFTKENSDTSYHSDTSEFVGTEKHGMNTFNVWDDQVGDGYIRKLELEGSNNQVLSIEIVDRTTDYIDLSSIKFY